MRLLNQISGQARPFFTLGVVALAWLVVPAFVKRFARTALFEAQAPALVTAGKVRQLQEYWALRSRSVNELIAAGSDTATALAGYELGVARLEQVMDENRRYRELLNLRPLPGWRYQHAGVMTRDFSAWWQQLVIDKGSDYGIPLNAPVVSADGVVGRVTEVHAHTAVVALVGDPGVRLSVVVEGDLWPVSYTGGDNPAFGPARGTVEYLRSDLTMEAGGRGRRLLTSGKGGVFPAGLPVGLLTRVEPSADGIFQNGEVLLPSGLSTLDNVTVLVRDPAPAVPMLPAAGGSLP